MPVFRYDGPAPNGAEGWSMVISAVRFGSVRVAWGAALLFGMMCGVGAARAQNVEITSITTDDREVNLNWNPVPGDTLTQAERLDVPTLTYNVPLTLGVQPSQFGAGDPVIGRGAGHRVDNQWEIYVGYYDDFYLEESPPAPPPTVPFDVAGGFQFGPSQVAVAFTEPVDSTSATQPGNYSFVPALTVDAVSLQDNGSTVILQVSGALPALTNYTGEVRGVTSTGGSLPMGGGGFSFQTVSGTVTPIASIQADPIGFEGQQVTVVGQVYIPTSTGPNVGSGVGNGYIQDGSNRGINIFGQPVLPEVNDVGNVVAVTGTVRISGSTVRLDPYVPTLIASGIPRLGPRTVPLAQALSSKWEGTFIEAEGLISRIDTESGNTYLFFATVLDTAFGGYQVWRAQGSAPQEGDFILLRNYSLVDSTWTFTGTTRAFSDPDSIILRGVEINDPDAAIAGPFNGFEYTYSVTWYETEINATVFPPRFTNIPETFPTDPQSQVLVVPNREAVESTPLLANVLVVPNPYNPEAPFGQGAFPSGPGVQFVNLPAAADISVYTVSGDLVVTLVKENNPGTDAYFWDLTNGDGKPISAGIYLYYITADGEEKVGKFVVIR